MSLFADPIPGLEGTLRKGSQGPQGNVVEFNQKSKTLTLLFTLFVVLGSSLVNLPGSQPGPRRGYRSTLRRGTWG